jgi:hypothetical protein
MGYLIIMIPCTEMLLNIKGYLENLHPHPLFVPLPLVTSKSNSTCAPYVTPTPSKSKLDVEKLNLDGVWLSKMVWAQHSFA